MCVAAAMNVHRILVRYVEDPGIPQEPVEMDSLVLKKFVLRYLAVTLTLKANA